MNETTCTVCGATGAKRLCKPCGAARSRQWRAEHPAAIRAALVEWRAANPDKYKTIALRYEAKHPARGRDYYYAVTLPKANTAPVDAA